MPLFKLPLVKVKGSNYDMGYQHGKICEKKIKDYLKDWAAIIKTVAPGKTDKDILDKAKEFISQIEEHTPHLSEEIRGLADGASISLAEAYMLQIRFELLFLLMPPLQPQIKDSCCTSFAISGAKTSDGLSLCGQNIDAQAEVEDYGIVLHLTPKDGPVMVMYTSVGQIGYSGINSEGLGYYGNMINSPDWKPGVPRYILIRCILECSSVEEAMKVFEIPRGASLNYLITDSTRRIVDVETTVTEHRVLEPKNGFIAHSNHFIHPDFIPQDTLAPDWPDTKIRLERITKLITEEIVEKKNKMTVEKMDQILSDHENFPRAICRHIDLHPETETEKRLHTLKSLSSMISKPEAGEIYTCVGNPCENQRFLYKL